MHPRIATLDRYMLINLGGTFAAIFGIVISLMLLEHVPRLFEVARLSGQAGYVVGESLISLLPEYAAVGFLFGLYLAIGMTVRRLSSRGELDALAAAGISPNRSMRVAGCASVVVALLLLWTQGWLMPAGERRLTLISDAMLAGAFGYNLESHQFNDLGHGAAIRFDRVNPATGELEGIFFRSSDHVVSAARGGLGVTPHGDVFVHFENGRLFDEVNARAIAFTRLSFANGGRMATGHSSLDEGERRNESTLPRLLASVQPADHAMAWSRLLWPVFALLVPFLAAIVSKPARGSRSWFGLSTGVILIVVFVRTTDLVASTTASQPLAVAAAIGAGWLSLTWLIVSGEHRFGAGYVDGWLRSLADGLSRLGRHSLRLPRWSGNPRPS